MPNPNALLTTIPISLSLTSSSLKSSGVVILDKTITGVGGISTWAVLTSIGVGLDPLEREGCNSRLAA